MLGVVDKLLKENSTEVSVLYVDGKKTWSEFIPYLKFCLVLAAHASEASDRANDMVQNK